MALDLNQPVTEMSTTNISCVVKAAGVVGWQIYTLHVPTVFKSGSLNLLETSGPVQGCNGTVLLLYIYTQRYADKRDREVSKLGSMSGKRAISATRRRELSSTFFPPARQGA
jgi:hypothetical protein